MPYWAKNGINFRLPQPGLLVKDGNLYANVAIDGAEVRYTTDGFGTYCPVNLMERTGEVWFPGSESKDLLPRQGKFDDYIEC